jgi:hypothetical protein
MMLTEWNLHRRLGIGLTTTIALWGTLSIFLISFQCGPSEPWRFIDQESRCLNLVRATGIEQIDLRTLLTMRRVPSGSVWVSLTSLLTLRSSYFLCM